MKEFMYKTKSVQAGVVEFENDEEATMQLSTANLGQIAFFAEYTRQDDQVPMSTKESWELFRRCPSFYSFNPNKPRNTKLNPLKKTL